VPVNPKGGKTARAAAANPLIEAVNVYLPHPLYAPWVPESLGASVIFGSSTHLWPEGLLSPATPQPSSFV